MYILAADPGQKGGIALLSTFADGDVIGIVKTMMMPMTPSKSKLRVDTNRIFCWLGDTPIHHSVIENVHAMPRQGVSSSFQFGRSFGALEGAMDEAAASPIEYLEPGVWKRGMGLAGEDKEQARMRATRLFGSNALELHWPLKKHEGIAEACLMGYYWYNEVLEPKLSMKQ